MGLFSRNQAKKQMPPREPERSVALPDNLLLYRNSRKGPMDMRTVVSLMMPLLREAEAIHEGGKVLYALRPDRVLIKDRLFQLSEDAACYEGVIYPGYSAPEVYRGVTHGARTDLYTLSALLYLLLVGEPPANAFFRLENDAPLFSESALHTLRSESSIYLSALPPENPFDIDWEGDSMPLLPQDDVIDDSFAVILEKGAALAPDDRFSSVSELIAALLPYDTKASTIYPLLLASLHDDPHRTLLFEEMKMPESRAEEAQGSMTEEPAPVAALPASPDIVSPKKIFRFTPEEPLRETEEPSCAVDGRGAETDAATRSQTEGVRFAASEIAAESANHNQEPPLAGAPSPPKTPAANLTITAQEAPSLQERPTAMLAAEEPDKAQAPTDGGEDTAIAVPAAREPKLPARKMCAEDLLQQLDGIWGKR